MFVVQRNVKFIKLVLTVRLTGLSRFLLYNLTLSNRRAIGEHTSTAVNCIPPAEVALNLEFGDFERNGDIYGHWGRDEGVE